MMRPMAIQWLSSLQFQSAMRAIRYDVTVMPKDVVFRTGFQSAMRAIRYDEERAGLREAMLFVSIRYACNKI